MSVVGLGCNNFGGRIDFEATKKVVHKALDLGITFFDEADTYGDPRGSSEACLGQILGDHRKEIVLATKFARPMDAGGRLQGASRRYIMAEVEASLRRLKTDWIDLYQQHQPDPLTPIEETLRALDDLVRQGKVRYIGWSHPPALAGRWAISSGRARSVTSAARPCRLGRSSRRSGPRSTSASTTSSRARRSTACSRAASIAR